uniref:Uncharacterized protein n=1 Tax=Anguilla anguilla TaxID=7936 RepID=A0A0E9R5G1_ANGAN
MDLTVRSNKFQTEKNEPRYLIQYNVFYFLISELWFLSSTARTTLELTTLS